MQRVFGLLAACAAAWTLQAHGGTPDLAPDTGLLVINKTRALIDAA